MKTLVVDAELAQMEDAYRRAVRGGLATLGEALGEDIDRTGIPEPVRPKSALEQLDRIITFVVTRRTNAVDEVRELPLLSRIEEQRGSTEPIVGHRDVG